jgi:hypothetical protein
VFPGSLGTLKRLGERELNYETTISAVENAPQTAARVPEPKLQQERARYFAQSPSDGPETPHAGLTCR